MRFAEVAQVLTFHTFEPPVFVQRRKPTRIASFPRGEREPLPAGPKDVSDCASQLAADASSILPRMNMCEPGCKVLQSRSCVHPASPANADCPTSAERMREQCPMDVVEPDTVKLIAQQEEAVSIDMTSVGDLFKVLFEPDCNFERVLSSPVQDLKYHENTLQAMRWVKHALPPVLEEVYLYTDGSFKDNSAQEVADPFTCAWAVVIVGVSEGKHYLLGELHGALDQYGSALAAEVAALAWAGIAVIQLSHVRIVPRATLCFDCVAAGLHAVGQWQLAMDNPYTRCVRAIFQTLQAVFTIRAEHTKSHAGHPWNEMADSLADSARCGVAKAQGLRIEAFNAFFAKPELAMWTWLKVESLTGAIAMPLWEHGSLVCRRPDEPVDARGDTHPFMVAEHLTTSSLLANAMVTLSVKCATANVLTLLPAKRSRSKLQCSHAGLDDLARPELLRAQFEQANYCIVGLQETRLKHVGIRDTPNYVEVSAPANQGQGGVALWLSKTVSHGTDSAGQCFFSSRHVTIQHADPRLLVVVVRSRVVHLCIAVGHAPCNSATDVDRRVFWHSLGKCVLRHIPTMLLIDANCSVGSITSLAISDCNAEAENNNGRSFRETLEQVGAWAPATWSQCQQGSGMTWVSPCGQEHRNDFVCLPLEWQQLDQVQAWVDSSVDIALTREDHRVAAVCFSGSALAKHQRPNQHRKVTYDRRKLKDPAVVQKINEGIHKFGKFEPVPWSVNVHDHCALLTQALRDIVRDAAPPSKRTPRKPYISEGTFELVQRKKEARAGLTRASRSEQKVFLGVFFSFWRFVLRAHSQKGETDALQDIWEHTQQCVAQCRKTAACHLSLFRQSARQVRRSALLDRAQFLSVKAANAGKALLHGGLNNVYQLIKPVLPKANRKRVTQSLAFQQVQESSLAHFAEVEAGAITNYPDLFQQCAEAHRAQPLVKCELHDLFTLYEAEQQCRRAKDGKACGEDGLVPELFRHCSSAVAKLLFPLLTKISITGQEPFPWKGGLAIELYKGTKSPLQIGNYRSIMITDAASKVWHSLLRKPVAQAFQAVAEDAQCGSLPGHSTAFSVHLVQCFESIAVAQKASSVTLYVDISQAYYSVVRQFVSDIPAHTCLDEALNKLAMEPFQRARVESAIHELGRHAGLSLKHSVGQWVSESLQHTWFATAHHSDIAHTQRGTRPGTPLADLLFACIFRSVLADARDYLLVAGLVDELFAEEFPGVAWADDLVATFSCASCSAAVPKAAQALEGVWQACHKHGLNCNLSKGKTEVIITYRGTGANAARKALHFDLASKIPVSSPTGEKAELRASATYKHLGCLASVGNVRTPEIQYRSGLLRGTLKEIQKPVLSNKFLNADCKLRLAEATCVSKLLYNAGMWHHLSRQDFAKIETDLHTVYRKACHLVSKTPTQQHATNDQVRACAMRPDASVTLRQARLKYFALLVSKAKPALWRMLEKEDEVTSKSWLAQVWQDLNWLRSMLPKYFQEGTFDSIEHYADLLMVRPKAWKVWVSKAGSKAACHNRNQQDVLTMRGWFLDILADAGVTVKSDQPPHMDEAVHSCSLCEAVFGTYRQLAAHMSFKHKVRALPALYVFSADCLWCLKKYTSSSKVFNHLSNPRNQCLGMLQQAMQPLEPDQCVKVVADEEGEGYRRLPPRQMQGPRIPTFAEKAALPTLWLTWCVCLPGVRLLSGPDLLTQPGLAPFCKTQFAPELLVFSQALQVKRCALDFRL